MIGGEEGVKREYRGVFFWRRLKLGVGGEDGREGGGEEEEENMS